MSDGREKFFCISSIVSLILFYPLFAETVMNLFAVKFKKKGRRWREKIEINVRPMASRVAECPFQRQHFTFQNVLSNDNFSLFPIHLIFLILHSCLCFSSRWAFKTTPSNIPLIMIIMRTGKMINVERKNALGGLKFGTETVQILYFHKPRLIVAKTLGGQRYPCPA